MTWRNLILVCEEYLGLKVTERKISIDELKDIKECGLCGTAAVISLVAKINDIKFETSEETVIRKLFNTLKGIQLGSKNNKGS